MRHAPTPIPDAAWERPEILAALDSADWPIILRMAHRYGWTWSAIAAASEIGETEISRMANGRRRVETLDVHTRLATSIGMPDHARCRLGLAPAGHRLPAPPATEPAPARGAAPASASDGGEASVHRPGELPPRGNGNATNGSGNAANKAKEMEYATDRRDIVGVTALVLGSTPAGAPLTSDDRLTAFSRATSAAGAVTAVEGHLDAVLGDYLNQQPGVVVGRLAAVQQLTDTIQAEYLLRPADTARLWKVAGVAAGVRGWLENNAGNTTAARSSLREAHRRGELIGDDQLTAWARYMQSVVEDYAGNTDAAERYAVDGFRHTSERSPQRVLLLVGAIAGARAVRGDVDGVDRAVGEAEIIFAGLSPEQHGPDTGRTNIDNMTTFRPANLARDAGYAYARLGQPDRFDDVTADARRAADRGGSEQRVYFQMDEGLAVLRSADPDPERAAVLTRSGLALADPFQTAHAGSRLGPVLDAAMRFEAHPAIVDLAHYSAAWRASRLADPTAAV